MNYFENIYESIDSDLLIPQTVLQSQWFGDSKVIDKDGKPSILYHGTHSKFNTFDISRFGRTDPGYYGRGFYLTPIKGLAGYYGSKLMGLYVSLKNPYRTPSRDKLVEFLDVRYNESSDVVTQKLIEAGYDGVIVDHPNFAGTTPDSFTTPFIEVIAFKPSQIKLADPITYDDEENEIPLHSRFDNTKDDIRY